MIIGSLLRWWVLLEILGVVALPISMRLLRALPERGVCFRRQLGLLFAAFALWLPVSLGFLQNTTAAAWLAVALVAVLSAVIAWRDRGELGGQLRALRGVLLLEAGIFLASMILFGLFRAYNPEITATEKPMEYAFINGILQSSSFPPHDPWLSGYSISYYYFGYVMAAMLTRLSALPSSITFNLVGVMLFALTVSGAFGLVYDLVAARERRDGREAGRRPGWFGALGGLLVAVMGNLVGVLELVRARGWGTEAFWGWFDVKNLARSAPSATWYPGDMWWWWRASRVIHDRGATGGDQEIISEFPFFSFLLGDNHPHVLALPFVLLALALVLNVVLQVRDRREAEFEPGQGIVSRLRALLAPWQVGPAELLGWGLVLGGLAFLNTWDYPIYLCLFVAALAIRWYHQRQGNYDWLLRTVRAAIVIGVIGLVAYLPFLLSLRSQAGGLGLVPLYNKTALQQFLLMFGVQIALVAGFLVTRFLRLRPQMRAGRRPLLVVVWSVALGIAFVAALFLGWWTEALCLAILGIAGVLLIWGIVLNSQDDLGALPPSELMVLLMIAMGSALLAAVEVVCLRDAFGTRMNTVFKFYYQGWVLLSVSGAHALYAVATDRRAGARIPLWRGVWLAFSALLVLGGLAYTAAATVSKAGAFAGSATLDGTAYVARERPLEYEVIEWLSANAAPDAVIVEASGDSYTADNWIPAQTGLQTLLGWAGHEAQWRGSGALPAEREAAVRSIYTEIDTAELDRLLTLYSVDYVLVGPRERQEYGADDALLARLDTLMSKVLQNEGYVLYARAR